MREGGDFGGVPVVWLWLFGVGRGKGSWGERGGKGGVENDAGHGVSIMLSFMVL